MRTTLNCPASCVPFYSLCTFSSRLEPIFVDFSPMEPEKADNLKSAASPNNRWRRAFLASSVLGGMLFSGAVILPVAVMNSAYRDSFLNSRLEKFGLTATSTSGSGSWFTAIQFKNVSISDESGRIKFTVKAVQTTQSVFGFLTNRVDLGKVTIVQPSLTVTLDENGTLPLKVQPDSEQGPYPDLQFEIQNAALVLKSDYRELPYIDLADLDIEGEIKTTGDGRWLNVGAVQIFDHEPLSEAHTEQNLALIAPVLSQSTSLSGEVSVRVEPLSFQLDSETVSPFPIHGSAIFHEVDARLKQQWAAEISQMLGRVVGKDVPNRLQITRESAVAFSVDQAGIHHRGLVFLLPDMASQMRIESSGVVGLDETLDLALALQLPQVNQGGAIMSFLSKVVSSPFQLQIKGTVAEPKLISPPGFSLVDQLSANVSPQTFTEEPPPVSDAVIDLISNVSSSKPGAPSADVPGGILDLIRSIQKAREDAPPKEKPVRRKKTRKRDSVQ